MTHKKPFELIDVTLRDAHQCLWSTRMTTTQMYPSLADIDRAGYSYINILGGAVFDVMVRFLRESPWKRMEFLSKELSTPTDALTRGQSIYTFELFPDDVVALNVELLAESGVKVLTVYDALNDNRNIVSSVKTGKKHGMLVNAMVTYALSPVHDDAYFIAKTRELVKMSVDFISVKDPTGLLTPERAATLFPAIVAAASGIPIKLHSHCQSGLAPLVYEEAIKAGFAYGYVATDCLANGASLPSVIEVWESARQLGRAPKVNQAALQNVDEYFDWLCTRDGLPRGAKANYDPALYEHQIPGGMISNLRAQLAVMGISHREAEILEETARVRADLGYPILVSPFAQYIVTQAILNVMQGERYKTIPDEVKLYLKGHYGKLAGTPSAEVMFRAGVEYDASQRPGELIEPALPGLRKKWGRSISREQLSLHAFYPENLALGLKDGAQEALNRGAELQPFSELLKYLVMKKEYKKIRTRLGGIELSFTS
ncbi:MAG: pyruvate carboxylase subunit B [Polynucleobacter sp.]|uniref:pyruvate carboxylase subunit B n=1 Tax=Polynucleobacter sp. TaxID=2029855 RepID=UPI00271FAAE8|nr:pyruvate carboxylase subunit B [Polynucleobacter sp.]MDO8713499.1 pyruvate carboxylase subunit B [Polynucleobacter sp.]